MCSSQDLQLVIALFVFLFMALVGLLLLLIFMVKQLKDVEDANERSRKFLETLISGFSNIISSSGNQRNAASDNEPADAVAL